MGVWEPGNEVEDLSRGAGDRSQFVDQPEWAEQPNWSSVYEVLDLWAPSDNPSIRDAVYIEMVETVTST